METDRLKRRLRYAKPQANDASIGIRERDLLIFELIQRHGPLPSHYLYEFTKHLGSDFTGLKHRLTQLYNGTSDGTTFLTRPPQQFASFMARYQYLIHDLAPAAKQLLAEHGRLSRFTPQRTDPFLHRFMAACVSASLELAIAKAGHHYISKEEIFTRKSCPDSTREGFNPMALPLTASTDGKWLTPDDLFGIDYRGKYRFLAVEIDRNTESIHRKALAQTAFGRKIHAYVDVMKNRTFREHWGVPNLMLLTVTTNQTHLENMLSYVSKFAEPGYRDRFLFKAKREFGTNWRVPGIMSDLYNATWNRAGRSPFSICDS